MRIARSRGACRVVGARAVTVLIALAFALLASACGQATETVERDPIRLQAPTVNGEVIVFDDLGDTDTVLWFWAPW